MKALTLILALLAHLVAVAGEFTLHVSATGNGGNTAVLYRYDDLFTGRTVRIAEAVLDKDGNAVLAGEVHGTTKARLRIGQAFAELYLVPGSALRVRFLTPGPGAAKGPGGAVRAGIEFQGLDAMDINALVSDLNGRIDSFLAEDLATDEESGMGAATEIRSGGAQPPLDTIRRPATLFVAPTWSTARTDTFERKLRRFYAEVRDPWFAHYLDHSLAGLRQGPRTTDRELFERHLKGRPAHYDDPEYVRLVRSLFEETLTAHVLRHHAATLQRALAAADLDSVKAVFARNDFLKEDDRLCELVALDQLYLNHNSKPLGRGPVARTLERAAASSKYPEHRTIAANMHWDITAMRPGSPFPPLPLLDLQGRKATLDSLLTGSVCIVVTESGCTYCELELAGLEKLKEEYKGVVPIIAISLDATAYQTLRYLSTHPGQDFHWFRAEDGQRLREDLRLHSLPAFLLLNDNVLARSPAPSPSAGLGALFHQALVEAEKRGRIKVWDD